MLHNRRISHDNPMTDDDHNLSWVRELEQDLKKTLRKTSPASPEVRECCKTLRDAYVQVIFSNHQSAQTVEPHQSLWKNVFYRCIREYRDSLRTCSEDIRNPESIVAKQQQITASLGCFLSEANAFYHQLMHRLRQECGETQSSKFKLSSHQCLIYLGDLARYSAQYAQGESTKKDFRAADYSDAAAYYIQASAILPNFGNPHNQLAVLATYMDNDLLALYRYFRSLAVLTPFVTAQENVEMLFRKSHQRYMHNPLFQAEMADKLNLPVHANDKLKLATVNASQAVVPKLWKRISLRLVELLAVAHQQPPVGGTFHQLFAMMDQDLAELASYGRAIVPLLVSDTTAVASGGASPLLQATVVMITLIQTYTDKGHPNANPNPPPAMSGKRLEEATKRTHDGRVFVEMLMVFLGRVFESFDAGSKEAPDSLVPVLPLLTVFLEWCAVVSVRPPRTSVDEESRRSSAHMLLTAPRAGGHSWHNLWQ
eukprot:123579-Prorocentrum_minimum.AAC.1